MNKRETPNQDLQRLIDRLVDGEMLPADQHALLLRLDQEPNGWRQCALTFLESQAWNQSLRPLRKRTTDSPTLVVPNLTHKTWLPWKQLAMAASILLAFALGKSWNAVEVRPPNVSVANSKNIATPVASATTTEATTREIPANREYHQEPLTPLDALVKRWEKQGFHADRKTRLATVQTQNGDELKIPMEEVRFHYIGDRTY